MNLTELARQAGLSKGAVSLALRDHPSIGEKTRRRVKALARKSGYTPDPTVARVMSAIARRRAAKVTAPLAILSLWPVKKAWLEPNSTLLRFYRGLVRRARELGFSTEEFHLGALSQQRMSQILVARGIEGLIVLNYPKAPAMLEMDVSPFACAVIGRALIRPRLFSTDHDHSQGLYEVLESVRQRGYSRPGLLLCHNAHERTMHAWAAAFQFYSSTHFNGNGRVPLLIVEENAEAPETVRKWFQRHRPDVIIAANTADRDLIKAAGIDVPADAGFASLFWTRQKDGCAGLDLQDEVVAGRAVELVVEQLLHNKKGIPTASETVLFPGLWRDGPSLPSRV